jgi:hypothetical protein
MAEQLRHFLVLAGPLPHYLRILVDILGFLVLLAVPSSFVPAFRHKNLTLPWVLLWPALYAALYYLRPDLLLIFIPLFWHICEVSLVVWIVYLACFRPVPEAAPHQE